VPPEGDAVFASKTVRARLEASGLSSASATPGRS
jgi:hypothetical protein